MGNTNGAVHSLEHAGISRGRGRVKWEGNDRADELIRIHYPTRPPELVAAMVAPLFPDHKITANMVIGRANRIGVQKLRTTAES